MAQPRLYYPVKPFHINQNFGDNMPCVKDFGLPTQDIVTGADNNTCPVGYDKLYQHFGMTGHNGTDLMAGEQNVYAAADGVVVEKETVPARGLGLGILTNDQYDFPDGQFYLKVRYWHLKSFYVEVGDTVKTGDLIGVSDNTGYSSGDHLHFEGNLFTKDAGGHPIQHFGTNMIAGAIDIAPYFAGIYAEDVPKLIAWYTALIPLLTKLINYIKSKK